MLLSQSPLPDYSTITALRHTGFAILQSISLQEAQDMGLTSQCLAIASGKGVIHFSEVSHDDIPILQENVDVIRSMLSSWPLAGKDHGIPPSHIYRRDLEHHAEAADDAPEEQLSGHTGTMKNGIHSDGDRIREVKGNGETPKTDGTHSATSVDALVDEVFTCLCTMTGRKYSSFEYFGSPASRSALVLFGSHPSGFQQALSTARHSDSYYGFGLILIRVYRPWLPLKLRNSIPETLTRVGVLEQLQHRTTRWGPVFMDVLTSAHLSGHVPIQVVSYQLGQYNPDSIGAVLSRVVSNLQLDTPRQNLIIGEPVLTQCESSPDQPRLESTYVKVLRQLFGNRLHVLNQSESDSVTSSQISSAPEYLLGLHVAQAERRRNLLSEILAATRNSEFRSKELNELLSRWASNALRENMLDDESVAEILDRLRREKSEFSQKLLSDPWLFKDEVPWIIGSEAWAYDLGSSGVHHLLSTGMNVNMLIIDSQSSSSSVDQDSKNRKKDIGLYAMNFGNAYVASVAVYSSYTQVMHAFVDAQRFKGPSIVLAYLPYASELDSPLQLLQETKKAVDSGYWPLYRWTPAASPNGDPVFQLDSERIKKELKSFIDRENHLTHLVRGNVALSAPLSHSHGSELRNIQKTKAREAIKKLMDGLSGPPVSILFASDGGNAESVAKRICHRGKARGLKPKIFAMDDFPIEDLQGEQNVVFCTSTAGQGEFPQNGREMWEALKNSNDLDLSQINYAVFALGDSHYWPRKEDKVYYNKPGKDLDARLEALGGKRLIPIGLGDDQDPDGYETGYSFWEPLLWKALGVDRVDADFEEPKLLTNEDIKITSNYLRGTIAEGLADTSTGAISESDAQLTKFHGTYMQDDRDLRDERKTQGLEPAYAFMVRVRMSGGVCQPEQWIAMDEISDNWGNQTFKLVSYAAVY